MCHKLYTYNIKTQKYTMKILITGGNGNIATMLKEYLINFYDVISPSHSELDILDIDSLTNFFNLNNIDVIIHTAVKGGRRTTEDQNSIVYYNLLMFENLFKFIDKVKLLIHFDSGAVYDRKSNILNKSETDISSIPTDPYGFSKYLIHRLSQTNNKIVNLRIFNIFHPKEEPDRFIKMCFTKSKITIGDNKYFDFVYSKDFVRIVKYYVEGVDTIGYMYGHLPNTLNISYSKKYTLENIANIIKEKYNNNLEIEVQNNTFDKNYSGDSHLIDSICFDFEFCGLEKSLDDYYKLIAK
jgi:GDP-L-fucose synthase